jgi:pimeloyl-ACP methyl ester carboxylesterase
MRSSLPAPDRRFLSDGARFASLRAELRDSMRHGPRGDQHDSALMVGPWDVRFEDVAVPTLIWQGGLDREAPPMVARRAAGVIAGSRAAFYPDDGHLSLWASHGDEILAAFEGAGASTA